MAAERQRFLDANQNTSRRLAPRTTTTSTGLFSCASCRNAECPSWICCCREKKKKRSLLSRLYPQGGGLRRVLCCRVFGSSQHRRAALERLRPRNWTLPRLRSFGLGSSEVFHVPLDDLAQRPRALRDGVPVVMVVCCEELVTRGLDVEGIFRVAGSRARVEELAAVFDTGKVPDLSQVDIHTVSGLLKTWLRGIPGSLFTEELYDMFLYAMREESDPVVLQKTLQLLTFTLPVINLKIVDMLVRLLNAVHRNAAVNRMDASNLGRVFAPALIRASPEEEDLAASLRDMPIVSSLLERVIAQPRYFFPSTAWYHTLEYDMRSMTTWIVNTPAGPAIITAEQAVSGRLLVIVEGGGHAYQRVKVYHPSFWRKSYRVPIRIGRSRALLSLAPFLEHLYIDGVRVDKPAVRLSDPTSWLGRAWLRHNRLLVVCFAALVLVTASILLPVALTAGSDASSSLPWLIPVAMLVLAAASVVPFLGRRVEVDVSGGAVPPDPQRVSEAESRGSTFRSNRTMPSHGGSMSSLASYVPLPDHPV